MGEGPVSVFDSGVGGLSVLREIRALLPGEELVYFADTAYCPYGDRPLGDVRARVLAVGRHLEAGGARLVVAACNTATAAALESLRESMAVPVVGLEPAVKPAARRTKNGRIGVLATAGTLASSRFARLVDEHARGVLVVPRACPGLVERIEEGQLAGPELEGFLADLTEPLRAAGVDTVVLGCTHYPFVREALARVLGHEVELLDSGPAVARRTASLLGAGRPAGANGSGGLRVLTTGDPVEVAAVVERLWGEPLAVDHVEV